jgi:hypothetical protein
MKCVFCNREYPADTIVCVDCNEYKGLITAEEERTFGMLTLDQAITNAMNLMEEARQFHQDEMSCANPDCECEEI